MSSHSYTIKVTQADIDAGVRNSSAHCIVATALGMQIPEATRISVDAQTIRFSIGRERLIYMAPYPVQEYVIAFDAGDFEHIKPIEVMLWNPMIKPVGKPATASRLIVKSGPPVKQPGRQPSATRAFGQRVFRVNQKAAAK